jgi:hypothetical protein
MRLTAGTRACLSPDSKNACPALPIPRQQSSPPERISSSRLTRSSLNGFPETKKCPTLDVICLFLTSTAIFKIIKIIYNQKVSHLSPLAYKMQSLAICLGTLKSPRAKDFLRIFVIFPEYGSGMASVQKAWVLKQSSHALFF